MSIKFLEHIEKIEDYRISGMISYPLNEVFLLVLSGILCRAEDFDEIVDFGQEQISWLRKFLPFEQGIPQAQTMRRIFAHLDAKILDEIFSAWVKELSGKISGVVAIDGKRLRGSKHNEDGTGALHLVSAYAHEAGLILGQQSCTRGGDEINAINEVLDALVLSGVIITIDAIGTQKKIASKIIKQKADYILALKGNQGTFHKDVIDWFKDDELMEKCAYNQEVTGGHGRIEKRTCHAIPADWFIKNHAGWTGLKSICAITSTREIKKTGKISTEVRYYISSLPPNAEFLNKNIRAHWSIENNLHWQLDVTFREDENRTRKDHAAHNLATMRRAALNVLSTR